MNFLKVAWRDISSIFKNRFIRISIIAIIITPLFYSLFYLSSFWDPYGNLDKFNIAVVNLDKGTTIDGKKVNYGDDFINELKKNKDVAWKFVSKKDADEGLRGTKYYTEVQIPADFSEKALSAKGGKPQKPNVIFKDNAKKNYIAFKISSSVSESLKKKITASIVKEYTKVTFDNLYDVKDGMNQAASGSESLKNGITDEKTGSSKLTDAIGQVKNKVPQMSSGVEALYNGINQLSNGINTTAVDSNGKALGLKNGASKLASGLQTSKQGASSLDGGVAQELSGLNQVGSGLQLLDAAVNKGSNGNPSLVSALTSLNSSVSNPDSSKGLGGAIGQINTAVNVGTTGQMSLVQGVSAINNGVTNELSPAITRLYTAINIGTSSTPSLSASVSNISDKSATLNDLLLKYNAATDVATKQALMGNIMKLSSGLSSGTNELNKAVNTDTDANNPSLKTAITSLNTAVNGDNSSSSTSLKSAVATLYNGVEDSQKGLAVAIKSVNTAVNLGSDGQPSLVSAISTISSNVTDTKSGLGTAVAQLDAAVNSGLNGQTSLVSGMNSIKSGSYQLVTGSEQLSNGANDLVTGTSTLASGTTQIKNGLSTLNFSMPTLTDGTNKLYDGSSTLGNGLQKLQDGSIELNSKLSDGSNKLNNNLKNTSTDMSKFVSSPLNVVEEHLSPSQTYGDGLAPYFIPISLWVGAIMMFFIITDETDEDIVAKPHSIVLGKYLSYGYIGIFQAVLVSVVVLLVGVRPSSILSFFLFNIFCSFVFIAIVQCLIFLLKDAGRLLSIIILVLQLASSGGTFPIDLSPAFYRVISPYLPFTYVVSALREIIGGIDYFLLLKDVTFLAVVLVTFLTTSLLLKGRANKLHKKIEAKKAALA